MKKLILPNTQITQRQDGSLLIEHKRTGLQVEASAKQLDSWAVKKLREAVTTDFVTKTERK